MVWVAGSHVAGQYAELRARTRSIACSSSTTSVAQALIGDVRDDAWCFDTELLVLAQQLGLRIHEVPVDWIDDPDSRVDIVSTALAGLRGVARLLFARRRPRTVAPLRPAGQTS